MMVYPMIIGELAVIAAICGLIAGSAPDRAKLTHNFLWLALIGAGMALILAAVTRYQPGWIREVIQPWADKLRQLHFEDPRLMVWIVRYFNRISGDIIWLTAGCSVWLVWCTGLIAFNCRCAVKSWWAALAGVAAGVAFSYYLWVWQYMGLGAFIILFGRFSYTIPWEVTGWAVMIVNSLLLLVWTLYSFWGKLRGWRVLVIQLAIWGGSYLACWGIAFLLSAGFAQYVKYQAVKQGVVPYRVVYNPPSPEIAGEIQKINDFGKLHPLFSLPVDSVYSWRKWRDGKQHMVPADVREYTLRSFDTPTASEYYQYYDNIINAKLLPHTFDYWQMTYLRSYTRMCAGRAALYLEAGKPDKILPQLFNFIALDRQKLADLPYNLAEFGRVACRMIWYGSLVSLGPDGPEYAAYYREALDYLKMQKVCLPDNAGVYLEQMESLRSGSYSDFLILPGLLAIYSKASAYHLSIRPKLYQLKVDGYHGEVLPWDVLDIYKYLSINSEVSLLLGRTGVALKLYRSEEGKYPAALAELVPKYLDQLPVSPFPDAPLIYQLDGNDFTLSIKVPHNQYLSEISSQKRY